MALETTNLFGNTIHAYTRAQAIQDGVLIDMSAKHASEVHDAGIRWKVAMTRAAYSKTIDIDGDVWGTPKGRAWDVCYMLARAIRRCQNKDTNVLAYALSVYDPKLEVDTLITLKAVFGPGDTGEPTITLMMPDED